MQPVECEGYMILTGPNNAITEMVPLARYAVRLAKKDAAWKQLLPIITMTATQLNAPINLVLGRFRGEHVAFVRGVAMYLSREMTALSFPDIGKAFGRDHSTVICACNKIKARMAKEPEFARTIEKLRSARHSRQLLCPIRLSRCF